jgi:hypothetical protein
MRAAALQRQADMLDAGLSGAWGDGLSTLHVSGWRVAGLIHGGIPSVSAMTADRGQVISDMDLDWVKTRHYSHQLIDEFNRN